MHQRENRAKKSGKSKWKRNTARARSSKSAGAVSGPSGWGPAGRAHPTTPTMSRISYPGATGTTPALGTRHVPGVGIDEAGPSHSYGGGPPDRQGRDVGRWSWVKWHCWGRG